MRQISATIVDYAFSNETVISDQNYPQIISVNVEECVQRISAVISGEGAQGPPGVGAEISQEEGNMLILKEDGLYAKPFGWTEKEW